MPSFSVKSLEKLDTCHPDLARLFEEVVKNYDCQVLCGHRGQSEQEAALREGRSKTPWPRSKHNFVPSLAVDVSPYPVDWNNSKSFYHFGGYVKRVAEELGIKIRWGGDWDGDFDLKDQNFFDLPHFELVE